MIAKFFVTCFIFLIRVYQVFVSIFLKNRCCFYPSCSHYAIFALKSRGLFVGTYLIVRRLLRCHPWSLGGVDFSCCKRL